MCRVNVRGAEKYTHAVWVMRVSGGRPYIERVSGGGPYIERVSGRGPYIERVSGGGVQCEGEWRGVYIERVSEGGRTDEEVISSQEHKLPTCDSSL